MEQKEEKELEEALVPWYMWQDAKVTFVEGLDMAEALMEPYPTNVSVQTPAQSFREATGCRSQLAT